MEPFNTLVSFSRRIAAAVYAFQFKNAKIRIIISRMTMEVVIEIIFWFMRACSNQMTSECIPGKRFS